jgi:hypothetical protein
MAVPKTAKPMKMSCVAVPQVDGTDNPKGHFGVGAFGSRARRTTSTAKPVKLSPLKVIAKSSTCRANTPTVRLRKRHATVTRRLNTRTFEVFVLLEALPDIGPEAVKIRFP